MSIYSFATSRKLKVKTTMSEGENHRIRTRHSKQPLAASVSTEASLWRASGQFLNAIVGPSRLEPPRGGNLTYVSVDDFLNRFFIGQFSTTILSVVLSTLTRTTLRTFVVCSHCLITMGQASCLTVFSCNFVCLRLSCVLCARNPHFASLTHKLYLERGSSARQGGVFCGENVSTNSLEDYNLNI